MNNKPLIIGLAAIAVIGVAVLTMSKPKPAPEQSKMVAPTNAPAAANPSTVPSQGEAMEAMEAGSYKAGKYTAVGNYTSPGGPETVQLTMSITADGTVQDVAFTPASERPMSLKYQTMFSEGYKPLVMGKKIDDIKLDKVSGSSLTPMGFNDAVEKIKEQAQG